MAAKSFKSDKLVVISGRDELRAKNHMKIIWLTPEVL